MREFWFVKGMMKLVEWEGDYRLFVKFVDVDRVLEKMYELVEDVGVEIMSRDLML